MWRGVAWRGVGEVRHRGMVQDRFPAFRSMPSSLLISSRLVRRMCRASLISNVVVCSLLGPTRWSPPTAFGVVVPRRALLWQTSVSPRLVAALCSFMRVSRALFVSPTARNLVHNSRLLQRVLVLDSCQLSAEGGCQLEDCSDVSSAYPSHIFT